MKTVAIIQARMGSDRLPGKVLMPILGQPAIKYLFDILRTVKMIDEIFLVTTSLSIDDPIEEICKKYNVSCYRGSVHDVLDRFRAAVSISKADVIVRITGDDILMDPKIIDKVISTHIEEKNEYTSNTLERSFPRGMDTEVINRNILEHVWKTTSDTDDREHVTLYIRDRKTKYKAMNISAEFEHHFPNLRLCIDTINDYNLVCEIYKHLYKNKPIQLDEVLTFLKNNKELLQLNKEIVQKKVKGVIY